MSESPRPPAPRVPTGPRQDAMPDVGAATTAVGSGPAGAPAAAPRGTAPDAATRRRVIAASFIGNFVEWFDYAAYGYLAVVIAAAFFPESDPGVGLMLTFGLFALSFLVRPIGGFVWGALGDRIGRRTALSWSILLMSLSTFCIALIPPYAAIGLAAPLLLLAARLLQGFSASGEYAGASAFLVEYAPSHRRGLYAAVVPASTAAGLLLGSVLAALLTGLLSTEAMGGWGWRLPFLLAAPLGLIGRYIRTKLEDTPAFHAAQSQAPEATPLRALLTDHWRALLTASGAVLLNAVGFYVLLSYMPTYLSETIGLGSSESYLVTTVALLTYIGFILAVGRLSDRFGRKRVLIAASVLFVLLTVPAFMALGTGSLPVVLLTQVLLGGMLALNDGTLPSFLAEKFPTRVRYSGFAVSFNLSNAVFGGTAPLVATTLIAVTHSELAPGWYLMGAALVSLVAVAVSVETRFTTLDSKD